MRANVLRLFCWRCRSMRYRILSVILFCLTCVSLWGQGTETSEARFQAMEERMRALEAQVQALQAALGAAPVAAAPQAAVQVPAPAETGVQGAPASLPVYGGASSMSKALNPDVSVIGNFIGGAGRNPLNPFPALSMRESEFGFQAILDPYARADFFLSADSGGASVEEGYITFTALPGGLSLKAGRLRSNFGKINAMHNHVLPWLDRPLVTTNLLGGDPKESDAGIKDEGLSVSRILPAPGGLFLEATGELYKGDSGSLFQSSRHSDVSTVDRLRAYRDLSDSTNIEIGGSYARGHNNNGTGFITQLYGFDATLRWKPLRRSIYQSFVARTEWDWSRREDVLGNPGGICNIGGIGSGCFLGSAATSATLRAHGMYASADYQLGRRWFAGGRFDWSQRARDPNAHDSGESLVLTYWPSEFSQVRGQFRRTNYAEGFVANEFLFQFQFSIGAHGAHPF
jgi:hypothetical protein